VLLGKRRRKITTEKRRKGRESRILKGPPFFGSISAGKLILMGHGWLTVPAF